jgi:isoleucyl-tRNA synthetase
MVRDLVRHIQSLRKEMGFDVADRVRITFFASDNLAAAVSAHREYIAGETLVVEINRSPGQLSSAHTVELGGEAVQLSIKKL